MTELQLFHPIIEHWFLNQHGRPTDIQEKAWPIIADNKNVLVTAPTGSGKTLTAFLWSINQFASGQFKTDGTKVLYVSPLKALNNDIRENLIHPLEQISHLFESQGQSFPNIRVMTRSGDTPQEERRKMVRHPPEILITTPESLNLLLSSKSGRMLLYQLSVVILDEIHSVAGSKRGVHLITAVDRLVRLSGEFQRIGLSATLKNKSDIAEWMSGYCFKKNIRNQIYEPRPIQVIESDMVKEYQIEVKYPQKETARVEDTAWDLLAEALLKRVERNRSTLFFTNGRRLCEKMTYKLNRMAGQPLAYSHHGSLSKPLRHSVEQHLKKGDLKAIISTSSLELGIDIGNLDEVVMIQSPFSISSAIQRVGRAGHKVGDKSRGTIFCAHSQDLIASVVLAKAVKEQDIEATKPVECPLDVLAQVLISEVCLETWDIDALYAFIRTSRPYRFLTRAQYDLVLDMLAGKYADTRIRELKPRVSIDRLDNTIVGKKGALLTLYTSGGTIPDRGYFQLRHQESQARIGELDEEYVWEAKIGQIATMGTQNWKITRITHNDVFALPVGSTKMEAPFWIAEGLNRDFHLSERMLRFLEWAQEGLSGTSLETDLKTEWYLDKTASAELIRLLKRQKQVTAKDLPHRHHLLLEYVNTGPDGGSPGSMLVVHTLWGGRLNRPWAIALEAAWEERFKEVPEIFPGNDAIVIQLPQPISPEDFLDLVPPGKIETLIRQKLEKTGFFSARFRECSGRALLVVKNRINQRMPLWMSRLKSKKLLENILQFEDFPILLETWRTCLKDGFDLTNLQSMLREIESGKIAWSQCTMSRPSPFAAGMAWNQINQYMYRGDQGASKSSAMETSLLQEVVFSDDLRPAIPQKLVREFEDKCQRVASGYVPEGIRDLVDWVKERIAIPFKEWTVLIQRMPTDCFKAENQIQLNEKVIKVFFNERSRPLLVSREMAPKVIQAWYAEKSDIFTKRLDDKNVKINVSIHPGDHMENSSNFLTQWLQFYGPVSNQFISKTLGIGQGKVNRIIETLIESRQLISGHLVREQKEKQICDSENFEILLRMSRAQSSPQFEALDIADLPLFLAVTQGLVKKGRAVDQLFERLEQLTCFPLPAEIWESEIIPARLDPYHLSFLDTLMQEGEMAWLGWEKKKILFCFMSDFDLIAGSREQDLTRPDTMDELESLFQNGKIRYDFTQLMEQTGFDSKQLAGQLWEKVWQTTLSNENFSALRKGIETKFKHQDRTKPQQNRSRRHRRSPRQGFSRWKGSLPLGGRWFLPQIPDPPLDHLEIDMLNKDRVRLLLDRYGIVFREILQKEMKGFRWADLFRSLRLMELSGEVLSGYFFDGIPGLQFMSHASYRRLSTSLPKDIVYSMNAMDPASVCGIPLPGLKAIFPERRSGTHLVFKGKKLKLVSKRNGREIEIHCQPDDKNLKEYLCSLARLLTRQFRPLIKIDVEQINKEKASESPYIESFEMVFKTVKDLKGLILYRKEDTYFY